MNELPTGWAIATVGDVTLPITVVNPKVAPDVSFNYVDIGSIDNRTNRITDPKSLSGRGAPSRARQLLRAGDTVVSTVRTYLRNIGFVDASLSGAIGSTGFAVLRPAKGVHPRLLYYYSLTNTFVAGLSAQMRGTSYPAVVDSQVRAMAIPVPPTEEQERIVAVIDEQFSRLDSGLEALERLPKRLAGLRRTLLKTMVGAEWPSSVLQDVAETRLGKMLSRKSKTGSGELPYLRNQNVQWGRFDLRDLAVMNFDPAERERFHLDAGDLLVCEGGVVGRCAVWEGQLAECYYQKALHRIRPSAAVRARWIAMVLEHFAQDGLLASHSAGITIQHLPQEDLRRLLIPLPPLHDQDEMIARLDEYATILDATRAVLARSEQRAKALRSAVLAHAFLGKLVAQDPRDEPAATLLERLKAERGSYNGTRTTHHHDQQKAPPRVIA